MRKESYKERDKSGHKENKHVLKERERGRFKLEKDIENAFLRFSSDLNSFLLVLTNETFWS